MRLEIKLLLLALIFTLTISQSESIGCLNHQGEVVDWFVVYTTNSATRQAYPKYGYLYFDSTYTQEKFNIYEGYGNQDFSPIGLTLAQIPNNHMLNLAWNDQLRPEQGTGVRDEAHSKFYMALTTNKRNGFAMPHSVPEYPSIIDEMIDPQIKSKQRKKAQHHFCFTIRSSQTAKKVYENGCFLNPNIYFNNIYDYCQKSRSKDVFNFQNYQIGSTEMKAIYKNGYSLASDGRPYEGDIFEGITDMLKSDIIAQTFGSPRPYQPLCNKTYSIQNSQIITVGFDIQWSQWFDHSKWAYALNNSYACFGDLNRNTYKQKIRGGAFYCVNNKYLNGALRGLTYFAEKCYRG